MNIKNFKKLINNNFINSVYCLLSPESFKKECSSYVAFGNEFIAGFFINIFKSAAYNELIKIGAPTIIKVNLPIEQLKFYYQKIVCREILIYYHNYLKNNIFIVFALLKLKIQSLLIILFLMNI